MVGLHPAKRDSVHWLCVVPNFCRHADVSFGGTNWPALLAEFGGHHDLAAGLGVAGLITQGMISFMTDQSFLSSQSAGGDLGYSLQNLMGLAFLGIWIIFSTIAAPVIIQRAIATGSSVGSDLLSGSFAAGSAAGMAGMMSMAGMRGNSGSGGGKLAAIKNAVMSGAFGGAIASATAAETLVAASMNEGRGGGSLIGSLVQMNRKSSTFPPDDPSGDKTVDDMIRDSKNSKT